MIRGIAGASMSGWLPATRASLATVIMLGRIVEPAAIGRVMLVAEVSARRAHSSADQPRVMRTFCIHSRTWARHCFST
jgi:hypothetical protein